MTTPISHQLGQIDAPGTFATRFRAPAEDLEIEVQGVGSLKFPIATQQARKLRKIASASPFGLRDLTLHNTSVRHSWEIAANQVNIAEQRWMPVLANYLETIRADLGLPDECNLEAEIDKLLLYEKGQFFKPHQDSEKCDQMFGTLVVILPSDYSGGAVTVEHRGEKKVFRRLEDQTKDLSLLAFYADCHHAVSPITSGIRVALTYRLRLEKRSNAALPKTSTDKLDRLTSAVQDYFTRPIGLRYGDSEPTPPERFVYLLDHEYTQRSLSWDTLKNGDRPRVSALRSVAERLDCECFLALAEVYECWLCDDDSDEDDRCGRRGWRSHEEDEDEDESSEPEDHDITDLQDSSIELNHWLDSAGNHIEGIPGFVRDAELYFTKPSRDMNPFKSEYEGYQGNYGNTLDRWYHRAAFVMWPRANTFALRAQASPQWAVDELSALPLETTAALESRVKTLLPRWRTTAGRVDDERFFAKLVKLSARFDDSAIAHQWLLPLKLERLGKPDVCNDLLPLIEKHGLSWAMQLFTEWSTTRPWGIAPWVPLLAGICTSLHASNRAPSQALAVWLVEQEANIALERCVNALKLPSAWLDLDRFTDESQHLAHVLAAAIAASAFPVLDATLNFLLDDKHNAPTSFLVSFLHACAARSPDLGIQVTNSPVHGETTMRLKAILQSSPRAEGDWRITYPLDCTCNDCKELAEFLGSDRTQYDWPLNEARRRHIHGKIDLAELPVVHVTLRRGSPYVLRLRKDDSLLLREGKYRERVKQILDALCAGS